VVVLGFEWDEAKSRENQRRHRVSFEEAETAGNSPDFCYSPRESDQNEERRSLRQSTSADKDSFPARP
jgi:uncharacterized DUF497 family protein